MSTPDPVATFPFCALLGQPQLTRALLLVAIDPGIGGVLVAGPRGTAKSTAARALAELLPNQRLVTLPLGASEEQLIGSLDLEGALQENRVRFAPGLLAKADGGALYVDEVNLLPDALVDQLLDVAASGVNIVERDGISHRHPARFALIGTMNPEEGELRPQLLDRFGLALTLANYRDPALRQAIVKTRLAFDADPPAFSLRFADEQQTLRERLERARAALAAFDFDDAVLARVGALCIEAGVDGLRADLVMLRAARALAAWQSDAAVTAAHVDAVSELVLHHRRNAEAAPPHATPPQTAGTAVPETARSPADREPTNSEPDWGELAPEPAATAAVKAVRGLPLKKL